MMHTFFELFAGAGGMSMGLEMAGWRCIGHAEIEPHARAVLRHHWPDTPLHGDVAQIDGTALRGVTMITGGSPCQDLSIAGKRAGMTKDSGTRSSLFFEQIRIWHESEAPFILWENVYGAFSSQHGRDFAAVLSAIVGAAVSVPADGWRGAGVASGPAGVAAWRTLDAQYFGVPQRRRRVFVLGVRGGGVDPAEVLSLAESLSGDSESSGTTGQNITSAVVTSSAATFDIRNVTSKINRTRVEYGLPAQTLHSGGLQVVTIDNPVVAFNNRPEVNESGIADTLTTEGSRNPSSVLAIDIYNQSISPDGIAHTIRAMNTGEGIPHTLTYEWHGMDSRFKATTEAPTLNTRQDNGQGNVLVQAVIAFDAYNQSDTGTISKTLNVGSDYSHATIVLRNREGKPGGGKGPLLSAERQRTLGTANDQVVFTHQQFGGYKDGESVAPTMQARDYKDATTLAIGQVGIPRRLTPTECERLMGWPDQHTAHGINEKGRAYDLPDTGRYKLCGNGIASPVVAWIGFQLRDALDRSKE